MDRYEQSPSKHSKRSDLDDVTTVSTTKPNFRVEVVINSVDHESVKTGKDDGANKVRVNALLPKLRPKRHFDLDPNSRCRFSYLDWNKADGTRLPKIQQVPAARQLGIRGHGLKSNQMSIYTQWTNFMNMRKNQATVQAGKTSRRWNKRYIQETPKHKESAYLWNYAVPPEVMQKPQIVTARAHVSPDIMDEDLVGDMNWQLDVKPGMHRSNYVIQRVSNFCSEWVRQYPDSVNSSFIDDAS